MPAPTITIPVEVYDALCADQKFLRALEAEGVDNWDGYDMAIERLEEDDE